MAVWGTWATTRAATGAVVIDGGHVPSRGTLSESVWPAGSADPDAYGGDEKRRVASDSTPTRPVLVHHPQHTSFFTSESSSRACHNRRQTLTPTLKFMRHTREWSEELAERAMRLALELFFRNSSLRVSSQESSVVRCAMPSRGRVLLSRFYACRWHRINCMILLVPASRAQQPICFSYANVHNVQARSLSAIFPIASVSRAASSFASVELPSIVMASVSAGSVVAPYPSHLPGLTPMCLYHSCASPVKRNRRQTERRTLSLMPCFEMKPRSNVASLWFTCRTRLTARMSLIGFG